MEELRQILRQMGVTRCYLGQRSAVRAVELVQENEDRLLDVVNAIYHTVAEEQNKTWMAVERQLRTAAGTAWKTNPDLLETIAGYPLLKQPTASEFIEILYNHTVRNPVHK